MAYDFLALRAQGIPELAEELQFWTEAQTMAPEQLAQRIPAQSVSVPGSDSAALPPKRKRRRSKPKPATE
jgi:poly(A) polymerase